ncbi:MAG: hypothetical protein K5860_07685 [Bacteroidales bacterium]|nr:hypothetical protein [Bacteroidales bacterium]
MKSIIEEIEKRYIFVYSTIIFFLLTSCTGIEREIKNLQSETIGLKRDIYLLSYNGDTIETFKSHLINSDNGASIYFEDENHKRISISGGIIITKEK